MGKIAFFLLCCIPFFSIGQKIEKMEYFIDAEPGTGKGVVINFTSSDTVREILQVPTDTLSVGSHLLYYRVLDSGGRWSPYVIQNFWVEDTIQQGKITDLEYFFDSDDKPGGMTAVQITPSDTLSEIITHAIDTLTIGSHLFHVRFKNDFGIWSPYVVHNFWVEDTIKQGKITDLEYFIDQDDQPGRMTSVQITSSDTLAKLILHSVDTLTPGHHLFHVRVKNDFGIWTPYAVHHFQVEDTFSDVKIASFTTAIDSFFHDTSAVITRIFNPPADSFNMTQFELLDSMVDYGEHVYRIWINGTNGMYTSWPEDSFVVIDCPMLDTAAIQWTGSSCAGDTVLFTQNITPLGIWPTDSFDFSWSVDGTAAGTNDSLYVSSSEADSILLQFSFSKISEGRCRGELNRWIVFSPLHNDTLTRKICANDSALIHGKYENKAGYYVLKTQSTKGCDSSSTIQLQINPVYNDTTNINICQGDSVLIFGNYRSTSGIYNQKLTSINQCDSITTVILNVIQPYLFNDTFSLCTGDSIFLHGKRYVAPGLYIDSFKSVNHCDSVYRTLIRVFPVFYDSTRKTICSGDSLMIHGRFEKTAGNYVLKTKSIHGCDSVSVLKLLVNKVYNDTLTLQICQGDSARIHGVYQSSTGHYRRQFNSIQQCDSFSTVFLQVNPVFNFRDTIRICAGDTVQKHGKQFYQPGQFTDAFKTIRGCDSIYVTRVILLPVYNDTLHKEICSGDSLYVHGKFEKNSGMFAFKTKSISGCDSASTIQLTVNPVYKDTLNVQICQGDSIRIHGSYEKQAGTYILNGKTQRNCDSTVTVSLKVNPVYQKKDTFVICSGDSIQKHGKTFKTQGNFIDPFKSISGCDSVFTTTLIVNPVYNIQLIVGRCGGDSVMFDGAYRYQSGIYSAMYKTIQGCDSSVRLDLSIDTVIRVDQYPAICYGDSILIDGIYRKQKGDYTETYRALAGCDSFVVKHLEILPLDTTYLNQTLCFSEVLNFHGQMINKAGRFKAILKNQNGCDSTLIIDIKVRNQNSISLEQTVCFGDSFWVGKGYKKGTGNFVDTLTDQFGCDSIVFYKQTERQQVRNELKLDICAGDSIFSGLGFKRTAGIYSDTLKNIFGCDSLVITDLRLKPVSASELFDTICFGETIKFFGSELKDPGSYNHTLQNISGCDSVLTLNLHRRAQFIPKIVGAGYAGLKTDTTYTSYQWLLNRRPLQGETSRIIAIEEAGIYDVTVSNELGCFANSWDDFLHATSLSYENLIRLYPNPASNHVTVTAPLTSQVAVYNNIGKLVIFETTVTDESNLDISHLHEGVYLAVVRYQNYVYTSKVIIAR